MKAYAQQCCPYLPTYLPIYLPINLELYGPANPELKDASVVYSKTFNDFPLAIGLRFASLDFLFIIPRYFQI